MESQDNVVMHKMKVVLHYFVHQFYEILILMHIVIISDVVDCPFHYFRETQLN